MPGRINRKKLIIDAAVRVLRRAGQARFSQPGVAREAGIPQGHLTYYFPKKSDILKALTDRLFRSDLGRLENMIQQTAPEHRLRALLEFSVPLICDISRTRALLTLMLEADASPSLRPRLEHFTSDAGKTFSSALHDSSRDRDADLLQAVLWGLGVLQFARGRSDPELVSQTLHRFEHLLSKQAHDEGVREAATRASRAKESTDPDKPPG